MSEGAPEIQPGTNPGDGGEGGTGETDWKAEAEKWRGLSRKNEDDFKKAARDAQRNAAAAEELRKVREAGQTEAERLASLTASLETRNTEFQTVAQERDSFAKENARLKAGLAVGLTLEDMAFIPDGTPEEMAKQAKILAERLGASPRQSPNFDGGARRTPEAPQTLSGVIRAQRDRQRGITP